MAEQLSVTGTPRHAEVAGGGIAGLAAATALARRGWTVRVHERSDRLRSDGSALSLGLNAAWVLEQLGAPGVLDGAQQTSEYRVLDRRGSLILENAETFALLSREALLAALASAACREGVDVRFGSAVVGATPDGRLQLADGEELGADLVVGADGVHSTVRGALGGATARRLPFYESRLDLDRELDGIERGHVTEYWSGPYRIGIGNYPGRCHLYFSCSSREVPTDGRHWFRPERWARAFPLRAPLMEEIGAAKPAQAAVYEVRCESWCNGRAVLVGDAAHAMSPAMGQAACLAMQNAFALANSLADAPVTKAVLSDWERRTRPVTDATASYSRRWIACSWGWPRALEFARAPMLRRLTARSRLGGVMAGAVAMDALAGDPLGMNDADLARGTRDH
jgi:2-polyprenyl-6-methoxyphenol hydroxylase-like FAD-dependent oxidoreductase